jgi:hypothetical protein
MKKGSKKLKKFRHRSERNPKKEEKKSIISSKK